MKNPATLLIAGWGHQSHSLAPLAAKIAPPEAREILALHDLAGEGETSGGPSPLAAALIAKIGETANPVELIGWSTGAMVALEVATWVPERVARLILIAGTAKFCADDQWPWGLPQVNLRAMIAGLAKRPATTLQSFFALTASPRPLSEKALSQAVGDALTIGHDTLRAHLGYLRTADLRDGLDPLTIPTALFHGQLDAVIPWRATAWLSERIPNAIGKFRAGQGHRLPLDDSDWLANEICAFRKQTEAAK